MLWLIGTLPAPITSGPLVILIYGVLILMLASALASILLRDTLYAVGAFAATMLLVALLYLTVAPALLFVVQLLVFTVISAALVIGLLRITTGIDRSSIGPFSREVVAGAAIAAVGLALLTVGVAATSWPVRPCCSVVQGFGAALANTFVVGLATVVVLLASAALGAGLIWLAPTLTLTRERGRERPLPSGGGGRAARGRR